MIAQNLPALQVVLPLLGAVVCALLRRGTLAWGVALVVSLIMPVISGVLLAQVLQSGPISYALGGWPPPWGIEYRVDVLNGFVLVLVSSIGAVMMPYARRSVALEITPDRQAWFYSMYMLCLCGLLGITITGDAFNAFVFLEISSLSTYTLIALGSDRRALLAAYQYLIMGTIGATFYVIGVGLLYLMTGTLNLVDIASRIGAIEETRPILAALAFLTVGISLKLALFPLHVWLPNAYAYAPSVATAFLSATATKVAIYLLLRFFFAVFGAGFVFEDLPVSQILLALSVAAIFGASTVAIFQDNLKRMLAYSSVAQIGYITLGIGLANQAGLTGAIVHLFNHALIKGGLFLTLGMVVYRLNTVHIEDLAGVGRRMPLTMFAFVLGGLSLIGVPLTVGFISKWYLVLGALNDDNWFLAVVVLGGSLLALVYVWRVIEVAYFRQPPRRAKAVAEAPLAMQLSAWILAGACIYFGIDTSLTVGIASRAAELLLAGLR